jgi:uncharacterized membrane protein YgcG
VADGFVPPQAVRNNAKRGLELREKHGRGGTAVGVARARDLSNGAAISYDTIKRMNSYFARHEVDKKGEGWGKDSAGYIAWLLWGGDAGWSWARGIIRQQESKEKSTMSNLTTSYFGIEKADRNADGTLTVYGKATDDSVDIDQQICDADWLDRAMPAWFKSGGNIREQHSNIAAGVAKEYEQKRDGHYITALVVDPVSVKKVENGVLKGFSIGIKNPRVTRDKVAANGRIVDGQIVEVSLVDRPANPNCQLVLAKSVDGDSTLMQVEELTEEIVKHPGHDQSSHGRGRGGAGAAGGGAAGEAGQASGGGGSSGGGSSSGSSGSTGGKTSKQQAKKDLDDAENSLEDGYKQIVNSAGSSPGTNSRVLDAGQMREDAYSHLTDARDAISLGRSSQAATSLNNAASMLKGEPKFKPAATKMKNLANKLKANPIGKATDNDLRKALQSALHLLSLNKSEEIPMKDTVELPVEAIGDLLKFDKAQYEAARDALANLIQVEAGEMREGHNEIRSIGHLLEAVMHLHAWYEGEEAEGEVVEETIELAAKKDDLTPKKGESKSEFMKRCKEAGIADEDAEKAYDKYMKSVEIEIDEDEEEDEAEKSAEVKKCLECGCNQPGTDHGLTQTNDFANVAKPSHVTTAEMYTPDQTPKSAEPDQETTEEEKEETEVSADEPKPADVEAIVEQAIKSATQSIRTEIEALLTAKEAAESHAMSLETELAKAKSLAVAGGPKRTAKPVAETSNDLLVKAAMYNAKAKATTDPTLAKGYRALADQYTKEHDQLNK